MVLHTHSDKLFSSSYTLCERQPMLLYSITIFTLYLLCMLPEQTSGIRWLGIYRLPRSANHPIDTTAERFSPYECQRAVNELGLRRKQVKFCNHAHYGYAMMAVLRAAHAVGYHCPKAFSDRRWNCTSVHRLPEVSPELKRGTREQALVHAFASAALLFEIGRYCALNKIRYCSCGNDGSSDYSSTPDGILTHNAYVDQRQMKSITDGTGALVYDSSNGNAYESTAELARNRISMTEGQPTVSRFYWAGCPDNLHVARQYASAFLGFPNKLTKTGGSFRSMEIGHKRFIRDIHKKTISTSTPDTYNTDIFVDEDDMEEDYNEENEDTQFRIRRNSDSTWHQQQSHFIQNNQYRPFNEQSDSPTLNTYQNSRGPFSHNAYNRIVKPFGNQFPNYPEQRWPRKPRSRNKRVPSLMKILNRHNYLAGVVLMEANQKQVCKCHGVSGSCAQQVCFKQLRRIDNELMQKALKKRYLAAKLVRYNSDAGLIAKIFSESGFIDEVVKTDELVFSEHSPDYCDVEPQRGSVGTSERLCSIKEPGTANCVNMCCGRGYRNVTTQETIQCNCRVGGGFQVHCNQCKEEIVTHHCL